MAIITFSFLSCASTSNVDKNEVRWSGDFSYTFDKNHRYRTTITGYRGESKEVDIPVTIEGLRVSEIREKAFEGKGLISITIPKDVSFIGESAFANNNLTSIIIPESIYWIKKSAFANNSLTNIVFPEHVPSYRPDGKGMTIEDSAFANNKLTSIIIPESIYWIQHDVFANNEITTVNLPASFSVSNFRSCNPFKSNPVTEYTVADNHPSLYTIEGVLFHKQPKDNGIFLLACPMKKDTSYIIPNGVTHINHEAFAGSNITNVTIPSSVTVINKRAFINSNLTSINIPASVTKIGEDAFKNTNISSLRITTNIFRVQTEVLYGKIYNIFDNPIFDDNIQTTLKSIHSFYKNHNGTYELKNNQWYYNGVAFEVPAKLVPGTGIYISKIDDNECFTREEIYILPGFHKIEVGYSVSTTYYEGRTKITRSSYSQGTVTFEHALVIESGVYNLDSTFKGEQILFTIKKQ